MPRCCFWCFFFFSPKTVSIPQNIFCIAHFTSKVPFEYLLGFVASFSFLTVTWAQIQQKKQMQCTGQIFAQRSNFSTSDVSFSDRLCGEPIFNFAQSTSFSSSYICQHLENLKHNLDFFFSFLCRSSKIGVASCKPILFDCLRSSSPQQIIFETIFDPFF